MLSIILLSLLDAFFTLKLVTIGAASEFNPVMNFFLNMGPVPFLLIKYALTVGGVLSFLVLKNFTYLSRKVRVSSIIVTVLALYVVLIMYELSLFYRFETEMVMR